MKRDRLGAMLGIATGVTGTIVMAAGSDWPPLPGHDSGADGDRGRRRRDRRDVAFGLAVMSPGEPSVPRPDALEVLVLVAVVAAIGLMVAVIVGGIAAQVE